MDEAKKLAEDHVDWLLSVIRPLMITEFLHGYKHGVESASIDLMKPKSASNA